MAIDLSSQQDTYLYLMSGRDTRQGYRHRNDDIDWPSNANSQILKRLPAGTYTVEATTYAANRTGSFKVQARIVAAPAITGLATIHDIIVGRPFSTSFTYRPAAALLTTTVAPSTLGATITDDAGEVTITATPQTRRHLHRHPEVRPTRPHRHPHNHHQRHMPNRPGTQPRRQRNLHPHRHGSRRMCRHRFGQPGPAVGGATPGPLWTLPPWCLPASRYALLSAASPRPSTIRSRCPRGRPASRRAA